jgi:hypothetical protein
VTSTEGPRPSSPSITTRATGGWASSPTRRCASAARRARSPASSGTTCRPTARSSEGRLVRPHGRAVGARRGATCGSSNCSSRPGARAQAAEALAARERSMSRGPWRHGSLDLHVRRLQALHERRLPRACPTGALIRTEFETVLLQPDVCNGCGYCIPACPFGVVDRDHDRRPGRPSARCATTAWRTVWSPRAPRLARPTRSSSGPTRSSSRTPSGGWPSCTSAARRARTSTAPATSPSTTSPAASGRSSC